AGMGTRGFVGQIMAFETMGFNFHVLISVIILHIIAPAVISWVLMSYFIKRNWVKSEDLIIHYEKFKRTLVINEITMHLTLFLLYNEDRLFEMERGFHMNSFMKRAVELAADNVREGGQPFGAVLVKDDEIIAEGVNELHIKYDVSGHAELLAIRRAQEA